MGSTISISTRVKYMVGASVIAGSALPGWVLQAFCAGTVVLLVGLPVLAFRTRTLSMLSMLAAAKSFRFANHQGFVAAYFALLGAVFVHQTLYGGFR